MLARRYNPVALAVLRPGPEPHAAAVVRPAVPLPPPPPQVSAIVTAIAFEMGIGRAELVGPSREDRLVRARAAAAYVARVVTAHSTPVISRALGRTGHTTVLNLLRKAERLRDGRDPAFLRLTEKLLTEYLGVPA
jgi:chromosomal replication initiation ATPase DnaA